MPEDSKKNLDKKKNDPKDQRRPRNSRNQAAKVEKKPETVEESKSAPKVSVPQKPPVYEDPGPEFYKNLKRETEEILKITEEENSKYKKKEIQSNWSKYEMPIESYEEIEEHDVGADYEKLIQAPLSVGGHFQFKHEKSWDVNTGPSLYDKYFEINMDNLSLAISTIPFYERNCADPSLFSETDMLSMNNRATKYKQKYFNDKTYSTPETEAQDRIQNALKDRVIESERVEPNSVEKENDNTDEIRSEEKDDDINLDLKNLKTEIISSPVQNNKQCEVAKIKAIENKATSEKDDIDDDILLGIAPEPRPLSSEVAIARVLDPPKEQEIKNNVTNISEPTIKENNLPEKIATGPKTEMDTKKVANDNTKTNKNPVIESPEDLEKWLDDFLDG